MAPILFGRYTWFSPLDSVLGLVILFGIFTVAVAVFLIKNPSLWRDSRPLGRFLLVLAVALDLYWMLCLIILLILGA